MQFSVTFTIVHRPHTQFVKRPHSRLAITLISFKAQKCTLNMPTTGEEVKNEK